MQTRFAPSFVVVCLLLAIGIVVALVLWATIRPDDPASPPPTTTVAAGAAAAVSTTVTPPPAPNIGTIQIATLASYDPGVDGDPATNWTTECYSGEYMGKAGVGVVMTLTAPATGTVSFAVGTGPYVVDVFTTEAERIPAQIDFWGERLERLVGSAAAPHVVTIPSPARHVLVLFRQAGTSSSCGSANPYQAVLGELAFAAS
jgi:hypothetical protein